MPTRTTHQTRVSQHDLNLIANIARFKLLSTNQIAHFYWPTAKTYRTAANRLGTLTQAQFLSRFFVQPQRVSLTQRMGNPTAVYYFSTQNRAQLKEYLYGRGLGYAYDEHIHHLPRTDPEDNIFSAPYITHELGISQTFLCFETSATKHGWYLIWERTSPRTSGITAKLTEQITTTQNGRTSTKTIHYDFNPDAIGMLAPPDQRYWIPFCHEYDNATEDQTKIRHKFNGYRAYHRAHKFPKLFTDFAIRHGLPISADDLTNPRVLILTVAANQQRRNKLYLDTIPLRVFKQFWFTSIDELTPDHALDPVWLRGEEYRTTSRFLKDELPPETTAQRQLQIVNTILNDPTKLPRVSLTDE